MTGVVDAFGRALLRITLSHPTTGATLNCDAWVDTGFNGELVLPQANILALGLPRSAGVAATLGDGSKIVLDTYTCRIDWFGTSREIEVITNSGQWPLLGVGLLLGHELHIDYRTQAMTLL
jgi:clan AA aspartic protease